MTGPFNLPARISIVVPSFNEAENVGLLHAALDRALPGLAWEMIYVDDNSPDGTAECARALAARDPRVRVVHRVGRRGLSSACVEGILASAAPYIVVMDADLQHDETVIPDMVRALEEGRGELVAASRYVDGGGVGDWSKQRVLVSRVATLLAKRLTGTELSDPMSGFFAIERGAFMRSLPRLSSIGFKILLDIAASAPKPLRVVEVPYQFRNRQHGESKLDSLVLWEYLQLLLDKLFGRYIPVRFITFAMVGSFGVLVHFTILTALFKGFGASFAVAQGAATFVAITNNFVLNNVLTYRDRRLQGWGLVRGWVTFNLVCATGAAANIGVADWLFERPNSWVASAIAGIAISVVWNYAMSGIFTWRRSK
jgi:dolichol-phosphate mannosyltransferase